MAKMDLWLIKYLEAAKSKWILFQSADFIIKYYIVACNDENKGVEKAFM